MQYQTYTVSQKKTCNYIFYNNLENKCPNIIIFPYTQQRLCAVEKWFDFPPPPRLSSATVLPWEITEKMTNVAVSNYTLFCE